MISCTCAVEGRRRRGLCGPVAAAVLGACLAAAPGRASRPHESVGWRATAIPIANFSSDDGTGYGLRCNLYEYDGTTVPYRRKYSAQAFATTGGKWVHRLLLDMPDVRPGERLEVELVYEKEKYANYYGGLPDAQLTLYDRDQKTFRQAMPDARARWINQLSGPWRLQVSARLAHAAIDANAEVGSLLRDLDPPGRGGGTLARTEVAVQRDTRDNYNDSESGQLTSLGLGYGVTGDRRANWVSVGVDQRGFWRLASGLVLAHWFRGDAVLGDVPFHEELEMGGSSTVRGQAASRDRGEGRLVSNAEVRWRGRCLSRRRQIYLGALAFVDVGQIFDLGDGPAANAWRRGQGVGLRLHWHSTIVRADYSRAGDRTGLYITFGQVF